jgi:hypothetical protein
MKRARGAALPLARREPVHDALGQLAPRQQARKVLGPVLAITVQRHHAGRLLC